MENEFIKACRLQLFYCFWGVYPCGEIEAHLKETPKADLDEFIFISYLCKNM